jgi:hypothetical protein
MVWIGIRVFVLGSRSVFNNTTCPFGLHLNNNKDQLCKLLNFGGPKLANFQSYSNDPS